MNLCLSLSVSLTLILLLLSHFSHVQLFATLRDFPGKNTRVDCHALLQEIFPTQGSNLHLMSPALAGGFFTTSTIWETHVVDYQKAKTGLGSEVDGGALDSTLPPRPVSTPSLQLA